VRHAAISLSADLLVKLGRISASFIPSFAKVSLKDLCGMGRVTGSLPTAWGIVLQPFPDGFHIHAQFPVDCQLAPAQTFEIGNFVELGSAPVRLPAIVFPASCDGELLVPRDIAPLKGTHTFIGQV
jgi:hypothetical protein